MTPKRIRIGYIGGQARRINERAIDEQWTVYLGDYAETVRIPPLAVMKLFGGSIEQWTRNLPGSLGMLSDGLQRLRDKYRIEAIYANLPAVLPYLMMARNEGGLKLSFLCIAHSVASEFWLKHWIGVAPLLDDQDVLLVSSSSSREALLRISSAFERAKRIPLCIRPQEDIRARLALKREASSTRKTRNLLSIGRIESVKNIHVLLRGLAAIRERIPHVHLYVAGEYTGTSEEACAFYRKEIEDLIIDFQLSEHVTFTGPVSGEQKRQLFQQADLLVNLSTDPGETFGFNLLEAKTWGLPVVCTSWNGFRDIVADGEEGLLTACSWENERPVVDEQAVVQAVVRLLSDAELRQTYSENTLRCVDPFDERTVMPKIIEALRQSLAASANRREAPCSPSIRSLGHLYHLPALSQLPYLDETPVSILSRPDSHEEAWMERVKPIIGHYAGGLQVAKL